MNYDFCILGAGVAGLSLADALQERSCSVLILEKNDIGSGASGTPGGLVNPATGRRGKKVWKAEQCYKAIRRNLEKVQEFSGTSFYRNNGLLRPALTSKMAKKMKKQYQETPWPEGWCCWQNETQIKARHPGINCTGGGLWLPIGLTVNVGDYLRAYAEFLRARGLIIETNCTIDYRRENTSWIIHNSENKNTCAHLVFATGYATIGHPFWKKLSLEGVKGQVAKFISDNYLLYFNHSISSMGYIANLGKQQGFIQGSTYEHDFEDLFTDKEGEQYLRNRTRKVLPELAENARMVDQWAGVRVNAPNRKPVAGRHPGVQNLHIFTGLGSKGLMYGKFLAEHYADHLKNNTPVFPEVSIDRF